MHSIKLAAKWLLAATSFVAPFAAVAATENPLYTFTGGADGFQPDGAPLYQIIPNCSCTRIYGTTTYGGNFGVGTIYQVDPSTGLETALYSFTGGADRALPTEAVIQVVEGGTPYLYGITSNNNAPDFGSVFKLNLFNLVLTTVHAFTGGADGAYPNGALLHIGNWIYGTTGRGGTADAGIIFRIHIGQTVIHTLANFDGASNGGYPTGALVNVHIGATNYLYGIANGAGANGYGTVFRMPRAGGPITTLHDFGAGTDGRYPKAALLRVGNHLFGTTLEGGTANDGTIFRIDLASPANENVVHSFAGTPDGRYPVAALLRVGNLLYGTTIAGGTSDFGTVFKTSFNGSQYMSIYSFAAGNDGLAPYAGLVTDGATFYGTTFTGGSHSSGTVFSLTDP